MSNNFSDIHELENSAQILLAAPNAVSNDQRLAAESKFLSFRNLRRPFQICKQILDSCHVDYVLFEAASLLRIATIREWATLSAQEIIDLRNYLLQYVVSRPTLTHFVRETIVRVVAIIIKRRSIEDEGADRRKILEDIQNRIIASSDGDLQMQLVGCSIIGALLEEYSTTFRSSDMGLAWEVHLKEKKNFEQSDLKMVFKFCVGALRQLTTIIPPGDRLSSETSRLLLRLICLVENILCWKFVSGALHKALVAMFEAEQTPSLMPVTAFADTLLDPELCVLFFELHMRQRHNSDICHHVLQCLIQLASLNGPVMAPKHVRAEYFRNYISAFLAFVRNLQQASVAFMPSEALACGNIIRKILVFLPPSVSLPIELLQDFLRIMSHLTCQFMIKSTQCSASSSLSDDGSCSIWEEACENILVAWCSIMSGERQQIPPEFCSESATEIFNTFIKCHLAPPDGFRETLDSENDDIDGEGGDADQTDRIKFADVLSTIGAMGRDIPQHSIGLMCRLLESRVDLFRNHIHRLSTNGVRSIDEFMLSLCEDIHWLLLVSDNLLALDSFGESYLIPESIMKYSIKCNNESTKLPESLRVLTSINQPISEVTNVVACDPVIRLVAAVFRLSQVESQAAEAGLHSLLSPQVSSSILSFLSSWLLTYVTASENDYQEISSNLFGVIGDSTEATAWTFDVLINKVICNLQHFASEPQLINDTVKLLRNMTNRINKCRLVLRTPGFGKLIEMQFSNGSGSLGALSSGARRDLMESIVFVSTACIETADRENYWLKVLKPIGDNFGEIIANDNFKRAHNEETVRWTVMNILDTLIGVARGCHLSIAENIFDFFKFHILPHLVNLINLFQNYSQIVEMILRLFCELSRSTLTYLNRDRSFLFNRYVVEIIGAYTHQQRRLRTTVVLKQQIEEEQYTDLILCMELVCEILSKDCIDWVLSNEDDESAPNASSPTSALQISFFCLKNIMELMTLELLKFPELCQSYFRTITLICELYPDKICSLDPQLLSNLFSSLEVGLTIVVVDEVIITCFEFIQFLAQHITKSAFKEGTREVVASVYESLKPFLKLTLDLVLSEKINSSLLPHASNALYTLICCYQEHFREMVTHLIASQADQGHQDRLNVAFSKLTHLDPLICIRSNRLKFFERFESFVVDVRGFLLVR